MRITAIKRLEKSAIGRPRLLLEFDNGQSTPHEAQQMYTFQNGQTLFLLETNGAELILADRDGTVSTSQGQPEFTLRPQRA